MSIEHQIESILSEWMRKESATTAEDVTAKIMALMPTTVSASTSNSRGVRQCRLN